MALEGVIMTTSGANYDKVGIMKTVGSMPYIQYHQTSNISCTLVSNKIVDHSDEVVGAAPTTSSFST